MKPVAGRRAFMKRRIALGLSAQPAAYVVSLLSLITQQEPTHGVEVGVFEAACSSRLMLCRPRLSMVLVDAYQPDPTATDGRFHTHRSFSNFTAADLARIRAKAERRLSLFGDRAKLFVQPSAATAASLGGCEYDFVFLDGDHRYANVRADIEAWWPLVRHGGFLSGHDYDGPLDRCGEWGVKRAADEFADRLGCYLTVLPGRVWMVRKK